MWRKQGLVHVVMCNVNKLLRKARLPSRFPRPKSVFDLIRLADVQAALRLGSILEHVNCGILATALGRFSNHSE